MRRLRTDSFWGRVTIVKHQKKIPYGGIFDLVISPNYTFEIFVWIFFAILSRSYFITFFIICGGIIMYKWGVDKKEKLYNLSNNTVVERTEI